MGRKTHESIGKALPNRTNIVVSRNQNLQIDGCIVTKSIEDAISYAKKHGENEAFIIGGGSIYAQAINNLDKIYITKVEANIEGSVYFPKIKTSKWSTLVKEKHKKDPKNIYDYTFIILGRK